jgi:hypothetical protein
MHSFIAESRDLGLLRWATERQTARTGNGCARFFSVGGQARRSIATQKNRPQPSFAVLRPSALLRVQVLPARRLSSP